MIGHPNGRCSLDLKKIQKRLDELEAEIVSLRKEITADQTISKEPSQTYSAVSETILKKRSPEWELFLGGNLLGKLGLLSILLACSWFVKYAFDNRWVNESGRVLIGLSIGFGFCLTGLQLTRRKFRMLPESVFGTGFSIVYLSLFGGYYYYDLFSLSEIFLYLALLSVFSSGLAYWIRKEILYVFALIGSILSPVLISTGENSYRFLFGYLVFLNILFFLISRKIPWIVSSFFLLAANSVLYYFWATKNAQQSGFLVPFLFITVTYLLFVYGKGFLFPKLLQKSENSGGVFPRWNSVFYPVFLVLNSLCFGFMGYVQLGESHPNLSPHFILFGAVLFSTWILWGRKKTDSFYPSQLEIFETIHLYLLLGFAYAALWDFSEGSWLTFSWITFTGVVSLLNSKSGNVRYMAGFWIVTLIRLYLFNPMDDVNRRFLINERFALYLLSSLFLFGTYYIQKNRNSFGFDRGYVYMGIFTLILGTLVDVYYTVYDQHYRNLGYSYVLAFYAFVFLLIGFKYSVRTFRIAGLAVAAVLVGKLYFYDIWTMSKIVRIVAGFTLGLGFILTSLFYQKFKEKLANYRNTSVLLLLFSTISVSFFVSPLNAEEINTKGYRYYKEIRIPKRSDQVGNDESSYYGKIKLDEDIVRHSGVNDRRIVYNGRTIPFISRNVLGVSEKGGEKKVNLLFRDKGESQDGDRSDVHTYVLKLPKIPAKTKYRSIVAKASGEYEIKGKIYLGEDPENWRFDSEFTIYNYQGGDSSDKIEFTSNDETYVRIEIHQNASNADLEFTKVLYESVSERMEFKKTVEKSDLESGFNSDTRSSVFYFRNPMKIPIHRAVLSIKEEKFEREIKVFFKNSSKEFERLGNGTVFRKQNGSSYMDLVFPKPISSELKLEIFDGDDDPLTLEKMEVFVLQEEIVFPLNLEDDPIQNLRIYYGNPYAFYPEFDFEKTFSESAFQIEAVIQEERENENFGYSIGEPPVSTWIIRGFFFFGITILAFLTYRVLRIKTSDLSGPVI
ncbi:DUF2339 domain-containing protein [Leptospira santarosai]|uniref:DUF2339 domain-containing protein n=1 Tax=Leptospira santarosai TaxID=28183 RepID=UPI0002EDB7E5|nr:DUF2339 domain-containing protein [Leptospira santarosai]